jgi:hypothetical protein
MTKIERQTGNLQSHLTGIDCVKRSLSKAKFTKEIEPLGQTFTRPKDLRRKEI